jgi:Rad3-related DNA helicase
MITKQDWIAFFPFSEPREEQILAIDTVLNAFVHGGKRFAVCDLGTGVGKSAIAVTVARYMTSHADKGDFDGGAWFLTPQKILQEQYERDFSGSGMKSIYSAGNYRCNYNKRYSCGEAQQLLRTVEKESRFWKSCTFSCHYKKDKKDFLEATDSVTNYSYCMTESNGGGKIKPRQLLVLDECHNVDSELSSYVEVAVTDRFASTTLGLKLPELTTYAQSVKWLRDEYLPKLRELSNELSDQVEEYKELEDKSKDYANLLKRHQAVSSHLNRLDTFMDVQNPDNWLFEYLPPAGGTGAKITFRPIDVSPFADRYLFRLGKHVLLMSATVINPELFAQMLGIPSDQLVTITAPCPFPKENRPILVFPVGHMNADSIDNSLPKVARAVQEILKEHSNVKGIIHCHSYKIVSFLRKNIKDKRLLFHGTDDRDEVLKKHIASKTPTVLVSPSMSEGVDLKGDLARFQVILKVPYPSLGDKIVRKRMHKWDWWYPMQTVKTVVQAVGRAVRSADDHAVTYILDSDWLRFESKHSNLLPRGFQDCIRRD